MRYLFVELLALHGPVAQPVDGGGDDEILEQLHQDWESTLSSAETLDFLLHHQGAVPRDGVPFN